MNPLYYRAPDLDKKDVCAYLDVKVTATSEGVDIIVCIDTGQINADSGLLTSGQTFGSLSNHE